MNKKAGGAVLVGVAIVAFIALLIVISLSDSSQFVATQRGSGGLGVSSGNPVEDELVNDFDSSGQQTNTSQTTTAAPVTAPTTQPISLSQVQITNLQLTCEFGTAWPECNYEGDGEYKLTGEVTNNSSITFTAIDTPVDVYDCPTTTIDSSCTHIGQSNITELMVNGGAGEGAFAPGITTEALGTVFIEGIPPIQGYLEWSYKVTAFYNSFTDEGIPATQ